MTVDTWSLVVHPEVHEWLYEIRKADRTAATLTVRAIQQVLEGDGPQERRPLVDRIKGSRVRELRELRPAPVGHLEVRVLFAFDAARRVVLLVAGDSSGNWTRWQREAVPLAEQRYREYQESIHRTAEPAIREEPGWGTGIRGTEHA
ncbi:MAG TPA: type II toxin-antitoxin system RelE/ParE family toxin [Natronosporangium sp.]|nr:type II toxin-antitoxin system RelE/ParE family toxin [Natronosporangium sp.]